MIACTRVLYHELGHRHLVDECRSVSDARGVLWRVWFKQRANRAYLHFPVARSRPRHLRIRAMDHNARTIEQYNCCCVGSMCRVDAHVSLRSFRPTLFTRRTTWLAWSIYGLRTLVLIFNFIFTVSINFSEITDITPLFMGGEMVSVPIGVRIHGVS